MTIFMTFFKMVLISFLNFRPIMQFAGWQRTGCSLSSLTVTCEDDRDLAYNFKASVIFIQDFVYEKLFKLLVLDLVIQEIMQVFETLYICDTGENVHNILCLRHPTAEISQHLPSATRLLTAPTCQLMNDPSEWHCCSTPAVISCSISMFLM